MKERVVKLSVQEAAALDNWVYAETNGCGPAFDKAMAVARLVVERLATVRHGSHYKELESLIRSANYNFNSSLDSRFDEALNPRRCQRIYELMPFEYSFPENGSEAERASAYIEALNEEWSRQREILKARYGE